MSGALLIWWVTLCTSAAINVVLWSISARIFARRAPTLPPEVARTRRRLLWLSAGYVLGCAFRSVFPMVDVPRMCLHDTIVSRIFIGRSVATVAELCFAAQWAIVLREAGQAAGGGLALAASRILLPLIVVAEILSWAAVLTSNYVLHAAENSLWTLGAVLALAGFANLIARLGAWRRMVLIAALVCAGTYVAFMSFVDVPMYLARWQADLAAGQMPIAVAEGLRETLARCVVTHDWAAWRQDVPWLTLYFSVAVWISIALALLPPFGRPEASTQGAR